MQKYLTLQDLIDTKKWYGGSPCPLSIERLESIISKLKNINILFFVLDGLV